MLDPKEVHIFSKNLFFPFLTNKPRCPVTLIKHVYLIEQMDKIK